MFLHLKYILVITSINGLVKAFDVGKRYVYDFETAVTAGRNQRDQPQDYKRPLGVLMTAELHLTPVWQSENHEKLVEIELKNAAKSTPECLKTNKKFASFSISPFYALVVEGSVSKYFTFHRDDADVENIKKALTGLLHYSRASRTAIEMDVIGVCDVKYNKLGNKITKSRYNCAPHGTRTTSHRSSEGLGATILQLSDTVYEFSNNRFDVFNEVKIKDMLQMSSNLWKANMISVETETKLHLKSTLDNDKGKITSDKVISAIKELETKHKGNLIESDFKPEKTESKEKSDEVNLKMSIKSVKKTLSADNLSKVKSASAFLNLLKQFRRASKDAIKKVIMSKDYKPILPQILDVVAFANTDEAVGAAFDALDFVNGDLDLIERYLLSLSLVPHPTHFALRKLLNVLKTPLNNEKIKASLVSAVGALARRFDENWKSEEGDNQKVLLLVKEHFESSFQACETENCKALYLRGFRNAALTSSMDFLIKVAENGGESALESLRALKSMGLERFQLVCETMAENVFYQLKAKQDSSARILAADFLFGCHTSERTLRNFFISFLDDKETFEFSVAVFARLKDRMVRDKKLRSEIQDLLRTENDILYLFNLYQGGSSMCLTRDLFSTSEVNSSYNLFMEMLPGGLLKKSSFDVNIDVPPSNEKLPVLSIGIFASGLSSFAGGSSDQTEDEIVQAGMELSFLGVNLRPYIFFESTSELMGHVWSGTGSSLTPALQGNFLITEVNTFRVLQNGLSVEVKLNGAVSVDLSAAIQISIWNRNSESEVKNGAALLVTGSLSVGPDPYILEESFNFRGKTSISFMTDLEFYDLPFKMCLKMAQPSLTVTNKKTSSISIRDKKAACERRNTKKIFIPSKSFHMHHRNNLMCAIMHNSK